MADEIAGIGHNSAAGKDLLAAIERIERFEEEKKDIADEIKNEKTNLKSKGFDLKYVGVVLKKRKLSAEERQREQEMTETYLHACGMI